MDTTGILAVFGAAVELDTNFLRWECAVDEVATTSRVHLDLCAHACQARGAQLVQYARFSGGCTSGICVGDDPLRLRASPNAIAQTYELCSQ